MFLLKSIAKEYISDNPKNSQTAAMIDNTTRKNSFNLYSPAKVLIKSRKTVINMQDKIFLEKLTIVNYTLKYG